MAVKSIKFDCNSRFKYYSLGLPLGWRILVFICLLGFTNVSAIAKVTNAQESGSIPLQAKKSEKTLKIRAILPKGVDKVEIRLISFRNQNISKFWDLSPHDPDQTKKKQTISDDSGIWYKGPVIKLESGREIWYPVVDIYPESGMEGVLFFEEGVEGRVLINGPFHKLIQPLKKQIVLKANDLENWENTIVVEPASAILQGFYLRQQLPVVMRTVDHNYSLLSPSWSGEVKLYAVRPSELEEISSVKVTESEPSRPEFIQGKGLEYQRLLSSLKATIDFTLRCQVKSPHSPIDGGLFLFYDLDAKTYRNSRWPWCWGMSVRTLLEAARMPELGLNPEKLRMTADEIGKASMRYRIVEKNDPLYGVPISRWEINLAAENYFFPAITLGDVLLLAGWAWIPLYEITGDSCYLQSTIHACDVVSKMMDQFKIIPHSYMPEAKEWFDFALCETGFGPEGLTEIYRVTGDERYREIGRKYIEQHLAVFQRDDGLWEELYMLTDGRIGPVEYHTRGLGWAMEGLLASHRLNPHGRYLELAKRMADQVIKGQKPKGYWTMYYNQPEEKVGTTQKATALWSYLLYQLYAQSKEERYLEAARKALSWCMDQQYFGDDPDAFGSIPDCNSHSGIGYRSWFNVSCLYTSGFFGLALLEELKLFSR